MIAEQETALRILMNEDLYLLPQDLFAEEYPKFEIASEEPVLIAEPAIPKFTFIGKNQQNFLIITNEALPENQLKALESTLSRKQLSLDDVAIVDFAAYPDSNFQQYHAVFMPQKLVCFGLKPEDLSLPETNLNEIIIFEDCQILYTYSFTEMLGNKEKTKAFWEQMKTL